MVRREAFWEDTVNSIKTEKGAWTWEDHHRTRATPAVVSQGSDIEVSQIGEQLNESRIVSSRQSP